TGIGAHLYVQPHHRLRIGRIADRPSRIVLQVHDVALQLSREIPAAERSVDSNRETGHGNAELLGLGEGFGHLQFAFALKLPAGSSTMVPEGEGAPASSASMLFNSAVHSARRAANGVLWGSAICCSSRARRW